MSRITQPNETKNLGLLVFGRKRPGFDQEWNKLIHRRCLEMLANLGFTCVGAETPVLD